jgi:hypothetical protein
MPTPTSATTRRHENHNRGVGGRGTRERESGNQKWGVVEDHTQPVGEERTATPSSKRTKKENKK